MNSDTNPGIPAGSEKKTAGLSIRPPIANDLSAGYGRIALVWTRLVQNVAPWRCTGNRVQRFGGRCLSVVVGLALSTLAGASEGAGSQGFDVTMPPGECRLTVFPDGSANLHYGAAPWVVRVGPQTFDYQHQLHRFKQRARQPLNATDVPDVALVLPGTSVEHRLQDAAHVRQLLEQAWQARLPPGETLADSKPDLLQQACDFD